MKAIIYNDDFGLSFGFTDAIRDSFLLGVTTATCIRTNGLAYEYALKLKKTGLKKLNIGLHLNITDGPSILLDLADSGGKFTKNFPGYYLSLLKRDPRLLKKISDEFEAQLKKVLADNLEIDHINSQDHIHMIPPIFEITCKLAKKYGIKYIRLAHEPFHFTTSKNKNFQPFINGNFFKFLLLNHFSSENLKILNRYGLKTTDAFYGLLFTNHMDFSTIQAAINNARAGHLDIIEVMGHPAYPNDPRDITFTSALIKNYISSEERKKETASFLSQQVKDLISTIDTISYADLK